MNYGEFGSDLIAGVEGNQPFDFVYDCVTSPEDTDYTVQMVCVRVCVCGP